MHDAHATPYVVPNEVANRSQDQLQNRIPAKPHHGQLIVNTLTPERHPTSTTDPGPRACPLWGVMQQWGKSHNVHMQHNAWPAVAPVATPGRTCTSECACICKCITMVSSEPHTTSILASTSNHQKKSMRYICGVHPPVGVRVGGVGEPLPSCLVLRHSWLLRLQSGSVFVPAQLPVPGHVLNTVCTRPGAQGRCGRCPPGSGVMRRMLSKLPFCTGVGA